MVHALSIASRSEHLTALIQEKHTHTKTDTHTGEGAGSREGNSRREKPNGAKRVSLRTNRSRKGERGYSIGVGRGGGGAPDKRQPAMGSREAGEREGKPEERVPSRTQTLTSSPAASQHQTATYPRDDKRDERGPDS